MQPWWVDVAVAAQGWATVAAAMVAGIWAVYTYRKRRQSETAIDLQVDVTLHPFGDRTLAFVADTALVH